MKKLTTFDPATVITHDGIFHMDEVLAIALIRTFYADRVNVVRTRDKDILRKNIKDPEVFVIDVGGIYDINFLNFDHHQGLKSNCSASLILYFLIKEKFVPERYRATLYQLCSYATSVDLNIDDFHNRYISAMDTLKNINVVPLHNLIKSFNRVNKEYQNSQFDIAVQIVEQYISNLMYIEDEQLHDAIIWQDKEFINSDIVILDKYVIGWKERKDGPKYIIFPDILHGDWTVMSKDSMNDPLPDLSMYNGFVFQHKNKFIAKFDTKENIINAVINSLT